MIFIDSFLNWIEDHSSLISYLTIFLIFLIIFFFYSLIENKIDDRFKDWARIHQWKYIKGENPDIYKRYYFLDILFVGNCRYITRTLSGYWKGLKAEAFNGHYETNSSNLTLFLDAKSNDKRERYSCFLEAISSYKRERYGCFLGITGTSYGGSNTSTPRSHSYGVVVLHRKPIEKPINQFFNFLVLQIKSVRSFENNFAYWMCKRNNITTYRDRIKVICYDKHFEDNFCTEKIIDTLI